MERLAVMIPSLALSVLVFAFALWLGLYLLARDPRKPLLRFTGLGLIAYAVEILAFSFIAAPSARFPFDTMIVSACTLGIFHFIPPLCWFGASIDFLPDDHPLHPHRGILVIAIVVVLAIFSFILRNALWFPLPLMVASLWFVWQGYSVARSKRTLGALLIVIIFFGLSNGLLLVPVSLIPFDWTLLAIGFDLVLLGFLIAVLDAFDEGEALLPDMLYSLTISAVMAVLFGGQAALVMLIAREVTLPLTLLLYGLIGAAVITQTFYNPIQATLDLLVFARFARLRQARADLRAVTSSLPRVNESFNLGEVDDAEFARLTRRALSHFGDLNRLSSSPLTRLPLIDVGLSERGAPDNTLERTAELKSLLTESIARLKPRDKGDFGTSDEWRYYNALYYPYVLGVRPYTRNGHADTLNTASKTVLDWFQSAVPERTLHNWQNAAARLIAQDLREQMGEIGSKWQ
jgi:hypothetical protein